MNSDETELFWLQMVLLVLFAREHYICTSAVSGIA